MSRITLPHSSVILPPTPSTTSEAEQTRATNAATVPLEAGALATASHDNESPLLAPVAAPAAALDSEASSGARSFAENNRALGTIRNGDGLLVEFLKLQMLDDSQQQINDVLSNMGSLACRTVAHGGRSIMSVYATNSQRAGKSTQDAIHRFQDQVVAARNELLALLAGLKPDQRARAEGFEEVDRLRNEVADLVLALADRHASVQRSTELR